MRSANLWSSLVTAPDRLFGRSIRRLEDNPPSIWTWLFIFTAIVFVRSLAEGLVDGFLVTPTTLFLQYPAYYLAGALSIMLILSLFSRKTPAQLAWLILIALAGILIVPLVDEAVLGGYAGRFLEGDGSILWSQFKQGLQFWQESIFSPGQRAEFWYLLAVTGIYLWAVTKNLGQVVVAWFMLYTVGFLIFGALPLLLDGLSGRPTVVVLTEPVHLLASWDESLRLFGSYLLVAATLAALLFWQYYRPQIKALIREIRPLRTACYVALPLLGLTLTNRWNDYGSFNSFDYLALALVVLTVLLTRLSVVLTNDLTDLDMDRGRRVARPLVSGIISIGQARTIIVLSTLFSVLIALSLNYGFLLGVLGAHIASLLYSCPPVRVRRFPLLPNFLIGAASGWLMVGGYSLGANIATFPPAVFWAVLLLTAVTSLLKDFTEVEPDRRFGINTLPVLLGIRRAQLVTGILAAGTALLLPSLFGVPNLWLPTTLLAAAVFFFHWGPKPDERIILLLAGFLVYMIFSAHLIQSPASDIATTSSTAAAVDANRVSLARGRLLDFLSVQNRPTRTITGILPSMRQSEEVDILYFPALILDALSRGDPVGETKNLQSQIEQLLLTERQGSGAWQFYPRSAPLEEVLPADTDDTALAMVALRRSGHLSSADLATFDSFKSEGRGLLTWPAADNVKSPYNRVDVLVNANAAYAYCVLGQESAELTDYLIQEVKSGRWLEGSVYSIHSPYDLAFVLSRNIRFGPCPGLARLSKDLAGEVLSRQQKGGGWGSPLSTLLAASSLLNLGLYNDRLTAAMGQIIGTVESGAVFTPEPFFNGGPGFDFRGYASPTFNASLALEVLTLYQVTLASQSSASVLQ